MATPSAERWTSTNPRQPVGGTVNTSSNTVSAATANLGTPSYQFNPKYMNDQPSARTVHVSNLRQLQDWAGTYEGQNKQYAFRGEADSKWSLSTSLGRYFHASPPGGPDEWRISELLMYHDFREQLLQSSRRYYEDWDSLDILALMQHYECPTRLLDFTFSPLVAAYFALERQADESQIWVVSVQRLSRMARKNGIPSYVGPGHRRPTRDGSYVLARKFHQGQDEAAKFARIVAPGKTNDRLAAQDGCFLNPSSISAKVSEALVHRRVLISGDFTHEALDWLGSKDAGCCCERSLFPVPNVDAIAREASLNRARSRLAPEQRERAVKIKTQIDDCWKGVNQERRRIDELQRELSRILGFDHGSV
jgi:hypothetical protein